jgi:hypothetical protein
MTIYNSQKGFNPMATYPGYAGMTPVTPEEQSDQKEALSNLLTDMTAKGAAPIEFARVVRHSLVVINSEKHNLNYKQSAVDNGIAHLKSKYQGASK